MEWAVLALLSAVCTALTDATVKRAMRRVDEYTAAWVVSTVAAVILWPTTPWNRLPPMDAKLLLVLLVSGVLNTSIYVLVAKGVRHADLSIAAPLFGLTPAFMLVTSPLLLGEVPSLLGGSGVLVVVIGSYLLGWHGQSTGMFAPIKSLLTQPGPRYMLGAAVAGSFAAVIDKGGVKATSPAFWAASVNSMVAVGCTFFVLARHRTAALRNAHAAGVLLSVGGCLTAVATVSQMSALHLGLATYVIAIKKVHGPISVVLGYLGFGEIEFRRRLLASFIILVGVSIILLA